VTVQWLADQGKLTKPPAAGADLSAPGDATTASALGYLHANCAQCHNENGVAWPYTNINLRLSVAERTPETTAIYKSTVGIKMQAPQNSPERPNRIVAGDPQHSALLYRISIRDGSTAVMPPIASKKVDPTGTSAVTSWIQSLK